MEALKWLLRSMDFTLQALDKYLCGLYGLFYHKH